MIVTFCGHSKYEGSVEDEKKILDLLMKKTGQVSVEFFLGGYGDFDRFAYGCAKQFQKERGDAKLILVTPYLNTKNMEDKENCFDEIIYPELEKVPRKYAIIHRNRWMVEKADIVISYVTHQYGGAYTMYQYAKRKKKEIYNISGRNI